MTALTCFKNKFRNKGRNNYREKVKIKWKTLDSERKEKILNQSHQYVHAV